MTVSLLLALLLASQPETAEPFQEASATAQENVDRDKAAPQEEGAPERTDESEPAAQGAPATPPPPPPPDGILPLAEVVRIAYAPRDRPVPVLFGETLVVVTETGSIDAYDAATGEFAWKLGLPGETLFRPQSIDGDTERLLLASTSGRLLVVRRETGELDEERELGVEVAMPPLLRGSELALVTPAGEVALFDWASGAERIRAGTGEAASGLVWSPTLLVVSGALRTLTAVDARDGSTAWTFVGRGPFRAAATIADNGRVYTGDDLGEFYSLGEKDGKVKFRWSTGGAVRLSPFVEGDRVYAATLGNNLYCYGAKGGSEQWRTPLPGRPVFGPVRVDERFLLVTYEGVFVEVQPQTGRITKSWAAPGELASPPSFRLLPRPLVPVEAAPSPLPTELDDGDVLAPRAPLWFERSRVAFALRNGDVVLAKHAVPVVAPPATSSEPTEPSEDEAGPGTDAEPPVGPEKSPVGPKKPSG